ncbi:MAG: RDD family protein [Xanthomonadales bacterium]|nr:RDD family protein [Xanthomonadales bacterium]
MNDAGEGWFVADAEGAARGPLRRQQLQAERETGLLGDEDLVWTLRLAEWIPLRRALGGTAVLAPGSRATARPAAGAPPEQVARESLRPQPPVPGPASARPGDDRRSGGPAARLAEGVLVAERVSKQALAAQAWRRWIARQIDTALLGGIGWAVLAMIGWRLGGWTLAAPSTALVDTLWLAVIFLPIAAAPLETVLLAASGYTPGRALLGLRVVDAHGRAPGLRVAGERAARVALYGQGLQVFPFALFAYFAAFGMLVKHGRTHWDRVLGLEVRTGVIDAQRWLVALALLGGAWAMFAADGWMRLALALALAGF